MTHTQNSGDIHKIFNIDTNADDVEYEIRKKITTLKNTYLNECIQRNNGKDNDLLQIYMDLYVNNHFTEINCVHDIAEHLMNPFTDLSLWKYITNMDYFVQDKRRSVCLIINIMNYVYYRHNKDLEPLSLVASNMLRHINANIIDIIDWWAHDASIEDEDNNFNNISLLWLLTCCDKIKSDILIDIQCNYPQVQRNFTKMMINVVKKYNNINYNLNESQFNNSSTMLKVYEYATKQYCKLWDITCNLKNINTDAIDFKNDKMISFDSFDTCIFYVLHKLLFDGYIALLGLNKKLIKKITDLETTKLSPLTSSNAKSLISSQIYKYISFNYHVKNIIYDECIFNFVTDFHLIIDELLCKESKNICVMNDIANYAIPLFYKNLIDNLKNTQVDRKIYIFIMNIVNGTYKTNNPTRYDFCCIFLRLNCVYLQNDPNDNNLCSAVVESLMDYTNDVDISELIEYKIKIQHELNVITEMVQNIIHGSYVIKVNEKTQKFIMKLTNNLVNISNNISESICDITTIYNESSEKTKRETEERFFNCFRDDYVYIHDVIRYIYFSVYSVKDDIISSEITKIILRLNIMLLKSYMSPIIKKSLMHKKLTCVHLECIQYILHYDNSITFDLIQYVELFEKISKNDPEYKNIIQNILSLIDKNNSDKNNDIEYPDEYLDGITYEPITEPVLIPNIDIFFNKSSIMTHLLNNQTNPLTREPLTLETFKKYNEEPEIVEKIDNFKLKLQKFIDEQNK